MTTYLEKSCSFGLLRVPFVNCRQFMYLVISFLVLRAGCGIWLYQFLIIAYHFTLRRSDSFCTTELKTVANYYQQEKLWHIVSYKKWLSLLRSMKLENYLPCQEQCCMSVKYWSDLKPKDFFLARNSFACWRPVFAESWNQSITTNDWPPL